MPITGSVTVSEVLVAIERLLLQMRLVPGLGQSRDGKIDGRQTRGGPYSGRSNPNIHNVDRFTNVQSLTDPAHTGATMHAVDAKYIFLQFDPRLFLMIRQQRRCSPRDTARGDYYWLD
jgi:hypothetical protein